ncbi:unnamed protein product, partial [Prorocentrum cordatum]
PTAPPWSAGLAGAPAAAPARRGCWRRGCSRLARVGVACQAAPPSWAGPRPPAAAAAPPSCARPPASTWRRSRPDPGGRAVSNGSLVDPAAAPVLAGDLWSETGAVVHVVRRAG